MFDNIHVTYQKGSTYPSKVMWNGKKGVRVTQGNSPTGGHAGINKDVYFFDDYVVKFGALSEVKKFINAEDRKHFAEVVYASLDKKWYVQKRVQCIPNAEINDDQFSKILHIACKYDIYDISTLRASSYGSTSNHQIGHNWTLDIEGNEVIYDY